MRLALDSCCHDSGAPTNKIVYIATGKSAQHFCELCSNMFQHKALMSQCIVECT